MDSGPMDEYDAEPGPSNAPLLDLRPLAFFPSDCEVEEFDSDEYDSDECGNRVSYAHSSYINVGTPLTAKDNDGGEEEADDESFLGSSNTEAPSDLQHLLDANRAYQEFLEIAIGELTEALEKNRTLQKELPAQLAERTQRRRKPKVRKNWYQSLVFHHPYFRDKDGMPAPPNEDELTRRANKELDPYIAPGLPWAAEECRSLVDAVQSNLLQQNLEALMDRKERLSEKLLTTEDPLQNAELKDRICQLEKQMTEVRGWSLVELLEKSTRPIDWLRIAAVDMRANRTAFGCEMYWRHLLDVRLNQGPWTPGEEERLVALATKWDERCWDKVAEELKSGRSAFQCALHYCRHHATRINSGPFTAEEDGRLRMLVNFCTEGDNISWAQVAHFMGTRSKRQVLSRYRRSMDPHVLRGKWKAEEDMMLLIAIKLYGSEGWSKVASLMPGRTNNQCREHYVGFFSHDIISGSYKPWEDETLVKLVEKHGWGCWSQVAKEMPWRTANSILSRYKRLQLLTGKDKVTAADLEKYNSENVTYARRQQTSAMDRRLDVYRRIYRKINTLTQRETALKLCKGEGQTVDRDACLRLYQRMLHQFQSGRTTHYTPAQARSLNRAIAQYAQPLYRPTWPNMAAYEHQEWHAAINVLHDILSLERPPVNRQVEQVGTLPSFEEHFRTNVVGWPAGFQRGVSGARPLLPPTETSVATFGRLVDRYMDGDLTSCWYFLQDFTSFPEISAALDAANVQIVRCTDCTSRALLEDELSTAASRELAPDLDQHACHRCKQLRETRRNYDVLCSRFFSLFFWSLLLVEFNAVDTVSLAPSTVPKGRKARSVRGKRKKPWVKEKWAERRRLAALAAAAQAAQGGQEQGRHEEPVAEDNDEAMPSTSHGDGSTESMAVDEGSGNGT